MEFVIVNSNRRENVFGIVKKNSRLENLIHWCQNLIFGGESGY